MTQSPSLKNAPKRFKYSPSSSSFRILGVDHSKYDSGCLRSILLAREGIRNFDIPEIYQVLGAHHEQQHLENLLKERGPDNVLQEVSLKVDTSDFLFSGRMDFVIDGTEVHETKGTMSKNMRRESIRKGIIAPSHLSQAVCYKMFGGFDTVIVNVAFYESHFQGFKKIEETEFSVDIDERGFISSNGKWTGYCAHQILEHAQTGAEYYQTDLIPPRPFNWDAKFGSPCHFCDFKEVCNTYEGNSFNEFKELAKEEL